MRLSDAGSGEWQLALALLSMMANSDVDSGEWQLAVALLSMMAKGKDEVSVEGEVRVTHSSAPEGRWGERAGSPITIVEGWHIPRLLDSSPGNPPVPWPGLFIW